MNTSTRATVTASLVALALLGCGARSSLEDATSIDGGDAGGGGGECPGTHSVAPHCPVAPGPVEVASGYVSFGGAVASSGCGFLLAWGDSAGRVRATTLQVVEGAWRVAPTAAVSTEAMRLDSTATSLRVTWDGDAFDIAWSDDSAVFLRRVSEDGALLGPARRLFDAPQGTVLRWLDASPSPGGVTSLRIGVTTAKGGGVPSHLAFTRTSLDGVVLVGPIDVTPNSGNNMTVVGLAHDRATDDNKVVWTRDDANETQSLVETTFDDDGAIHAASFLLRGSGEFDGGGVVQVGCSLDFATLNHVNEDRVSLLVGTLTSSGFDAIDGVGGQTKPLLAVDAGGTLGVLSDRGGLPNLTFIRGGVVTSTTTETGSVGDLGAFGAGLVGGNDDFGVAWLTSTPAGASVLHFTTVAPR